MIGRFRRFCSLRGKKLIVNCRSATFFALFSIEIYVSLSLQCFLICEKLERIVVDGARIFMQICSSMNRIKETELRQKFVSPSKYFYSYSTLDILDIFSHCSRNFPYIHKNLQSSYYWFLPSILRQRSS